MAETKQPEKKPEAPMTPVVEKKPEVKAPEAPKEPEVKNPSGPTVDEDSWLYHKDFEPKLHKKGEAIESGWEPVNKHKWYRDVKNNFAWRKK